jgi:hypothetical protein
MKTLIYDHWFMSRGKILSFLLKEETPDFFIAIRHDGTTFTRPKLSARNYLSFEDVRRDAIQEQYRLLSSYSNRVKEYVEAAKRISLLEEKDIRWYPGAKKGYPHVFLYGLDDHLHPHIVAFEPGPVSDEGEPQIKCHEALNTAVDDWQSYALGHGTHSRGSLNWQLSCEDGPLPEFLPVFPDACRSFAEAKEAMFQDSEGSLLFWVDCQSQTIPALASLRNLTEAVYRGPALAPACL